MGKQKGQGTESAAIEFSRAVGLLIRKMRAATPSEQHGLSWTQKSVLSRLQNEGPATTADLARAEGVKPQSMSAALAALEEMGVIEREAHQTDGRQVIIKLSAKGALMLKNSQAAKHGWLSQAIAKLDRGEQTALFESSKVIKRLAEM